MFNSIDQYRTLFSLSMLLRSMRFSTYCALCLFPNLVPLRTSYFDLCPSFRVICFVRAACFASCNASMRLLLYKSARRDLHS